MKLGRSSYKFNQVYLQDGATVVGTVEGDGPLGKYFDYVNSDLYFGQKSWEQAEIKMVEKTISQMLAKTNSKASDIDLAIGGDLVNQLVPSNYAMRSFDIPFLGVYSACASVIEAAIIASKFINSNSVKNSLIFASSHNNMAEKQFRMPVEYGGPKSKTAQYTTTGAGAGLLSSELGSVQVESATIGFVVDAMQNNPSDMGTAMAPAAAETILRHFQDLSLDANYYDLIITGDLASIGSPIMIDLLQQHGYDISAMHQDCGNLIYGDGQDTLAGASGAGCISVVLFSYIIDLIKTKKAKKILVVGTGALLNALIVSQKETIPCIAHAIALSATDFGGETL